MRYNNMFQVTFIENDNKIYKIRASNIKTLIYKLLAFLKLKYQYKED